MISLFSAKQSSYLATIANETTAAAASGSSLVFTVDLVFSAVNLVLSFFLKKPHNVKLKV
ncbi:hypothetical protein [Fontibacillus phaseoli]|uniref:hypothetical protein n=1 Tax=Fontibacillus phaseoli TaxID=1416533 RepID=UPI0015F0FFD0|nr:hypothetical protein [Fontibacillus phaseoli]